MQGKYPIIDQGQDFIGGYTDNNGVFPKDEYVIFGDHTCVVKYVDFSFAQGADGVKVLKADKTKVLPKFLYYSMSRIKLDAGYARHWAKMKNQSIALPDINTQKRIISLLDFFEAICTDLCDGIPAEITARQKQYEYYRDKLLSFNEAS